MLVSLRFRMACKVSLWIYQLLRPGFGLLWSTLFSPCIAGNMIPKRRKEDMMSRHRLSFWLVPLVAFLFLAGCHRNPEAQKREYLSKGAAYFEQGKYPEAVIMYEKALQIDSQFADAHFGLAQCFLKQSDLPHAYQELMRTVEIDPANTKAQLDLGNLYLAARKLPEALDRAKFILKSDPKNAAAQLLLANVEAGEGNLPAAVQQATEAVQSDPN